MSSKRKPGSRKANGSGARMKVYGDVVTLDFNARTYDNLRERYRKIDQPRLLEIRMKVIDALLETVKDRPFVQTIFHADKTDNMSGWQAPYVMLLQAQPDINVTRELDVRSTVEVEYHDEHRVRFRHMMMLVQYFARVSAENIPQRSGGSKASYLVRNHPQLHRAAEKIDAIRTYSSMDDFMKKGAEEIGSLHKGPVAALKIFLSARGGVT